MTTSVGSIRTGGSGLIFHHDATLLDLADGDPFQVAPNAVPNRDCTVYGWDEDAGGARRPTFRTGQIGGLPALDFDGAADIGYLYGNELEEINVPANPFNHPAGYPLFVVAAVVVDAYADACIIGQASEDPGIFGLWHSGLGIRADGRLRAAIANNGGTIAEGGAVPIGAPTILSGILKQGATKARIDGVEVGASAAETVPYPYTWATIGAADPNGTPSELTGTDYHLNGKIGEIRIYRGETAVSLAFVESVEAELAAKWGA